MDICGLSLLLLLLLLLFLPPTTARSDYPRQRMVMVDGWYTYEYQYGLAMWYGYKQSVCMAIANVNICGER